MYSTNVTRTNATGTNVTETNVAWVNIQNTLEHLHLVDLGYMQKFHFIDHQEVVKKDGLRGWVGGLMKIMPRCGSILQVGTCQILSLAENPRWSQVWQKLQSSFLIFTLELDFLYFSL